MKKNQEDIEEGPFKFKFDAKSKISKYKTDPSRELGVPAMAHTTASLKTHTGHGHHHNDVGRQEVVRHSSKDRQSTSKQQQRQAKHLTKGITTPTPVQQSSEV